MADDLSLQTVRDLVSADLPRALADQVGTIEAVMDAWPEAVTSFRDLCGQVIKLTGNETTQATLLRYLQSLDLHTEGTLREALSKLMYIYANYPPDTALGEIVPDVLQRVEEFL